jgi:hypothetical protein
VGLPDEIRVVVGSHAGIGVFDATTGVRTMRVRDNDYTWFRPPMFRSSRWIREYVAVRVRHWSASSGSTRSAKDHAVRLTFPALSVTLIRVPLHQ